MIILQHGPNVTDISPTTRHLSVDWEGHLDDDEKIWRVVLFKSRTMRRKLNLNLGSRLVLGDEAFYFSRGIFKRRMFWITGYTRPSGYCEVLLPSWRGMSAHSIYLSRSLSGKRYRYLQAANCILKRIGSKPHVKGTRLEVNFTKMFIFRAVICFNTSHWDPNIERIKRANKLGVSTGNRPHSYLSPKALWSSPLLSSSSSSRLPYPWQWLRPLAPLL